MRHRVTDRTLTDLLGLPGMIVTEYVKQLNERLTKLRRSIQAQADPEVKESLKGSRWLLVRNRAELTAKEEEKLIVDPKNWTGCQACG